MHHCTMTFRTVGPSCPPARRSADEWTAAREDKATYLEYKQKRESESGVAESNTPSPFSGLNWSARLALANTLAFNFPFNAQPAFAFRLLFVAL